MSRKKKSKTQRRGKQTLRSSTRAAMPASPAASRLAPQAEFNPDYSYIIKDLKRIGTLAGSFLAILVILSFFL